MDKIKSLLVLPNLDSPMNNEAAADYKNGTWAAKAKQMTQTYAKWFRYSELGYLKKEIKTYLY